MSRKIFIAVSATVLALVASATEVRLTQGPARLVKDVNTTPTAATGSFPNDFVGLGNLTVFVAGSPATGGELWAGRALKDMGDEVRALGPPAGIERSLAAKLDTAASARSRPNGDRVALNLLGAFTREVEAHVPAKISEEAAAGILEFAQETEDLLHGERN